MMFMKMAFLNNRNYIGVDISPEYCEMAQQRLNKHDMMNGGNVTRN